MTSGQKTDGAYSNKNRSSWSPHGAKSLNRKRIGGYGTYKAITTPMIIIIIITIYMYMK